MKAVLGVGFILLIALCHSGESQTKDFQFVSAENEIFRSTAEKDQLVIKPTKIPKLAAKQTTGNSTTGQTQVTATRQGPCQCANGLCGCCSRILLSTFRQKACVNITYEPDDFRFTANVLMNDRVLYTRSISGKNPSPFCVPVPRIPIVKACVRFYNIYFQGRNVHACVNMEGKFQDTTLFKIGLDCLRLGANGVAVVKPEDGDGLGFHVLPEDNEDEDADNDEYVGEDDDDDDGDDDDNDDDDDDEGLFDLKK